MSKPRESSIVTTALAQQVVRDKLIRRLGKEWQIGDRLPPIKQLARVLGSGQSNTHLAVRQLASDGVLISRPKEGTFVARLPEAPATVPVDLRGRTVEAIYTDFGGEVLDTFILQMIDGFQEVLGSTGARVRVRSHVEGAAPPNEPADGIALFNMLPSALALRRPGQHVVVVSTSLHSHGALPVDVDAVGVNDHQGAMLAGEAMASLGIREACFVGRSMDWPTSMRLDMASAVRLYGFEAGLGATVAHEHTFFVAGYSLVTGGKAYRAWRRLASPPHAIFAASDDLAVGFCTAAIADGLQPGQDFHIIGFDGQERGRTLVDGGLTTVAVPAREMGRRAAQLLRDRMLNAHQPVWRLQLDCTLRSGATCRPFLKG